MYNMSDDEGRREASAVGALDEGFFICQWKDAKEEGSGGGC
jgi:hypothetical protein